MTTTIGFLGLGTMGLPMAAHLLDHLQAEGDADLLLCDLAPDRAAHLLQRGARWAQGPADLAACRAVVVMVPDLSHLAAALDGAEAAFAAPGDPVRLVVCSTVSPTGVVDFAARWVERSAGRVRVVDAPVSGGQEGAEAATLSIMVGGPTEDVEAVMPLLEAMGRPVHLGPLGSGQVAKACNQLVVAATLIAWGEACVLAERSGLDLACVLDMLGGGLAASRVLETKARRLAEQDYSPSGPARFLVKDLGFAVEAAHATGVAAPLAALARDTFVDLTARGLGDLDTAVVRRYVEETSTAAGDGDNGTR